MDVLSTLAAVSDAELMQGESPYRGIFMVFISFGAFACFVFLAARSQPLYLRPLVLAAGTVSALLQLAFLAVSVTQQDVGLQWWEGLVLPLHALLSPTTWSSVQGVTMHAVPSLAMLATLLAIPVSWMRYRADVREAERLEREAAASEEDAGSSGAA